MDDLEARLATGLTRGTAHVVFFLDEEFVIRWVSPSSTDMLGWSLDELVGRSGLHFVHPDDLGDIGRLVFEEIRSPHEYGADPARRTFDEVRLATVDGTWKAFEFAANNLIADPEVRGFVVVMRDVTERRMQDDVWSSMAAGSPIEVTAELVAHLLSWQSGGVAVSIDLPFAVPITVGEPPRDVTPVTVDLSDGMGRVVIHHPVDPTPSAWVGMLVERAGALLDLAVRQAVGQHEMQRRLAQKTALISAVSHDLRSPLAAIELMSTLLDGDGHGDGGGRLTDDQRRQLVSRIGEDARRTSRLLTDLTAVDKILHGAAELVAQPVRLSPLVERVAAEVTVDGLRSVHTELSDVTALADPVLAERIVDNLVSNALKHAPLDARVRIVVEPDDDHALVHVDDDGPGVPVDVRSRIFEAYVRGEDSAARPGSGMGLFLARTFAEVQGGSVSCSDSPWGGARFSVRLPRGH